jgi:mannitol 2-dehydrogenase
MQRLNAGTLGAVRGVPVPGYDRSRSSVGIVHFGVGGFHRAHQAMYVDRLLTSGVAGWGIYGVGTQPTDRRMRDVLAEQDGLYTLLLRHPAGVMDARVIGSIVEHTFAPDDPVRVIARIAAPSTKVVSLTITEGGYHVDLDSLTFDPQEPSMLLDMQPDSVPTTPFGLVVAALRQRREEGHGGLVVMSCDNIPHNGDVARAAVIGFASQVDKDLADWIDDHVRFPNSMVDRITPTTSKRDVEDAAALLGLRDEWPVAAEPFHQWVLQRVDGEQPPWAEVGVTLVDDVTPYELMKLRMLNAGHQVICYLGYLAGHRYTDEACSDELLRTFLHDYLSYDAGPTLPHLPAVDLDAYAQTLLDRFASPAVRDPLSRLCAEGSDRIVTFLLPVIRAQLAAGRDVSRTALVLAGWARYAAGVDEDGKAIDVVDRLLERVRTAADRQANEPTALLRAVPGLEQLAEDPRFAGAFAAQLRSLLTVGARRTLAAAVKPVAAD